MRGRGKPMGQVIKIDEARIRDHLGEMVRGTVEETLNALLDAEADEFAGPAAMSAVPGVWIPALAAMTGRCIPRPAR